MHISISWEIVKMFDILILLFFSFFFPLFLGRPCFFVTRFTDSEHDLVMRHKE